MTRTKLRLMTERYFAELHGQPLGEWIADRREEGMTWRQVEKELYSKTDAAVDVSHPTLIAWYGDRADREPVA